MALNKLSPHLLVALLVGLAGCGGDGQADGPVCGDGVVDAAEACDSGIQSGEGACPTEATECGGGEDACEAWNVEGSADACTAECVATTVTACVSDDGCCPHGCTGADDTDCLVPTGGDCPCDEDLPGVIFVCDGCGGGRCWQPDADPAESFCTEACETNEDCVAYGANWSCADFCWRDYMP